VAVSQTRRPTRLPVGTSVWHVTLVSTFASFEAGAAVVEAAVAGEVAVVEATATVGAWDAVPPAIGVFVAGVATAGALAVDACSAGLDAQPQTTTLVSRMMVVPEVRISDIC